MKIKKKVNYNFRNSAAYNLARGIKRSFRDIKRGIKERGNPEKKVITLFPEGPIRGRVLFSYIIDGFLLEPGIPVPNKHTNYWQSMKMAETFVELGYEVDVIDWKNNNFIPTEKYSFFVDVRHNLERLAPIINKDCVKIMHFDTAHMLFHNSAEANRLLQLQQRRGVTLELRRLEKVNFGIEHADYVTTVGNDFVIDTIKYANKKNYRLPSPCAVMFDLPTKDWDTCKKHFLWFSSGGLVHKGLDLALEAFSEMPECHLTVCAPVDREKDFKRAFYKELYETSNIKTSGFVDINSNEFKDITSSCIAVLGLSCSEGGGASVKTCMHAGLIPVVSYESAVDVQDFGYILRDCSINNIKNSIRNITKMSPDELRDMAHRAWKFARNNFTRENFSAEYRRVILEIIEEERKKKI